MRALRLAAATLIAVAVAGSTGAGAAPRNDAPLLSFDVEPGLLGLCATDLRGHTFRLTDPHQSGAGVWSPDGSQLAYMSGPTRLDFIDAEGNSRGSLGWPSGDGEHTSVSVGGLAWSPDSRSLAGVVTTGVHYGGVYSQLWVSHGSMRTLYSGGPISQPSWSPDGRQIALSDWTTQKAYVVDVDGGNSREILDSADGPVFSPDGQKVAYVVLDANRQSVGLAIARADGSDRRRLTQGNVSSPAWSPDGKTIGFTRNLGASSQIELIEPDGTHERVLASGAVYWWGPVWSPNGDALAYMPQSGGVVVIGPDGTNARTVATGLPGTSASAPSWRRAAPLPTHRRACVIAGTPGADVLRGKNKGDVLYGGDGGDRIYGAGGNDVLIGGPGHDWLYGGRGRDVVQAQDYTRDYLFGGPGRDRGTYDLGGRDKVKSVEHYDAQ